MIRSHLVRLSRPSWRAREDKSHKVVRTCAVALGVAWVATALGWAAHLSLVTETIEYERSSYAFGRSVLVAALDAALDTRVKETPRPGLTDRALVKEWARTAFKIEGKTWGEDEVDAMADLAWEESRYSTVSTNSSSGAYGLYQFLPSTWKGTGIKQSSDGLVQTVAAVRYISDRYGCPCDALTFQRTPRLANGVVQRYY